MTRTFVFMIAALAGCSFDARGMAASGAESDTSAQDDARDSSVPFDSSLVDAFEPDTVAVDAFEPDTVAVDAFEPDTVAVDAFAPEAPVTATLSCAPEVPSAEVDLTAIGVLDWAHWGLGGLASNWNRKAGAAAISKGSIGLAAGYAAYPTALSWTDGAPTGTVIKTAAGVFHGVKGASFAFDVEGDPGTGRTLRLYTAYAAVKGTINLTLSDSSAGPTTVSIPPAGLATGLTAVVYSCRFRPASAGARLNVLISQTTDGGYLSLQAAALY